MLEYEITVSYCNLAAYIIFLNFINIYIVGRDECPCGSRVRMQRVKATSDLTRVNQLVQDQVVCHWHQLVHIPVNVTTWSVLP